jgi:hypothetical protein
MPLPLIPIAIVSLATAAYGAHKIRTNKKEVSAQTAAERAIIYDTAINTCKDSEKLRKLAGAFKRVGCDAEAAMLCKRACLIDTPADLKEARREALDKGLSSVNKQGVLNLANAYDDIGATAAASKLRKHAATLDQPNPGIGSNPGIGE